MSYQSGDIKCVLLTGVAGFIASNVAVYLVEKYPQILFIGIDKMSYCSNRKNFEEINDRPNFKFIQLDLLDIQGARTLFDNYPIDTVIHFAAYTHVDHSFGDSIIYTQNNVLATHILLEVVKTKHIISDSNKLSKTPIRPIQRFIHVSTDEVYGSSDLLSEEDSILDPTNPYAATKAAAEHLVKSYYHSFRIPVIITRGNNVYGPKQYPEKVIPKFCHRLINKQKCIIQGSGLQRRSFMHVNDVVSAFECIMFNGKIGEIYNIGSDKEYTIKDVAEMMSSYFYPDSPLEEWITYGEDRHFNDHRYNISSEKLQKLGWNLSMPFEKGLYSTIKWYISNPSYWDTVLESIPENNVLKEEFLHSEQSSS